MDERKVAMKRRTKAFASLVVKFYIALDKSQEENRVLGRQLLRSGTSVAANYREASRARSDAEPSGTRQPAVAARRAAPAGAGNSSPRSNSAPRKPTKANSGSNYFRMTAVLPPTKLVQSGRRPMSSLPSSRPWQKTRSRRKAET